MHARVPCRALICVQQCSAGQNPSGVWRLQAEDELLHSEEYLQATLQFLAHIQTLSVEEHRLVGRSSGPTSAHSLEHVVSAVRGVIGACALRCSL